jgi:hypothetical protein
LWDICEIELEIGLVLESFEEEFVLTSSECRNPSELSIDTESDMDLSFCGIIVDI